MSNNADANNAPATQISFDTSQDRLEVAQQAIQDPKILAALIENLAMENRRIRQFSAAAVHALAETDAQLLLPYVEDLIDCLNRPEAQTRWECFAALAKVVALDPPACEGALTVAEDTLYDDRNATVRNAALGFICAYGLTHVDHADKVWPIIDEALQIFHGNLEYQDMLDSVLQFAAGDLPKQVKDELAERMEYDAANNKYVLGQKAARILEICRPQAKVAKKAKKPKVVKTVQEKIAAGEKSPQQRGGEATAKVRVPKKAKGKK